MMSFAIDGGSWEYKRNNQVKNPEKDNRGELVSANIPEYMRPGERIAVSFTCKCVAAS
jgi:hypothetical protein